MEGIRALFNKGPVVLFKWRIEAGFPVDEVSDNVIKILGYSSHELTDSSFKFSTLIHPEDVENVMQEAERIQATDLSDFTHKPYRLVTKYGDIIWVQDHTHLIRNQDGIVTHFLGYIYNITDQVASERELVIAQHKLTSTLKSIDELIFVIDDKGKYTAFYSNENDENLTISPEEFLGKHYSDITTPENAELLRKNLEKVVETGKPVAFQYTKEIRGKTKHFAVKVTPNTDIQRQKVNYTIALNDITESKEAEIRIKEYYELFSKSNDLLAISHFDGTVEAVNPLWERKFGYSLDHINENGFLYFVHDDDKEQAAKVLQSIREERPSSVNLDCRVRTKSAGYVWTEWVSTIDYENKKVYSVTRDITEFKNQQAKAADISKRLFSLTKKSLLLEHSLEEFLSIVAREACRILEIDRFTFWTASTPDLLQCVVCYDGEAGNFIALQDIFTCNYPDYFKAVSNNRIMSSSQPTLDDRFKELHQDYFKPHSIKSTMDASIIGDEGLEGVLCAETVKYERSWTLDNEKDLSSIGEIIRTAISINDRRKAEQALARSERLMVGLADKMPGLVHIKEPNGKHIYGNQATLDFLGLSADEYRRSTHHDLFEKSFADKLSQDDLDCVQTGKVLYNTLQDPFGSDRYYEEYKFPITIPNQPTLIGGIVIDVTDRKKAEYALIDREAKYKMLVELANAVHWKLDIDKDQFTYMDEKIFELTGYPASEFKTMENWASKIHPLERSDVFNECQLLSNKGEDHELVYRNIKPDGDIVWIKDSVSVLMQNGKPASLVGYMIDVTEQKNAEIKLVESEKRFRSLVNDIKVGIIVQDADSQILLSNTRALDLLDLSEDQLLGKTSYDPHWKVVHSDGSSFQNDDFPVPMSIREKRPISGVIMGVNRPRIGDIIWLQVDATPQLSDGNKVVEIICTFVDVTKRISAERERNESLINLQLAEQIAEVGYWSYDPIAEVLVWSDQMFRIYEVTKEEYIPKTGMQNYRLGQSQTEMIEKAKYDAIHHGRHYDLTLKYNFESNNFKWIRIISTTSKIEGQEKYFIRGTVQDVTPQKQAEEELKSFTKLQKILTELSADYINMPFSKVDESIQDTLRQLGDFVGADRAYVFNYSSDFSTAVCTNVWVRHGVTDIALSVPFTTGDLAPVIQSHKKGKHYVVEDLNKLSASSVKSTYQRFNIKSMLTVPLIISSRCVGLIGFDTVYETKVFSEKEIDLLKVFSELLINLRQKVSYEKSLVEKQGDLERALEEKDTLFKELHHRIKNNLQLVSSLLYIKLDNITDPLTAGFINETITRILSISKIHDQLLKIEEVYELNIKTYIEELTQNIVNTYCPDPSIYPLHISVKNVKFHIDDVLLIGLLINESVSNIIKYAYESDIGGDISITLDVSSTNNVKLIIADHGKGLPFSSLEDASQSNGIQLIRVFAEQLKGTLSLSQEIGTIYQVRFAKRR